MGITKKSQWPVPGNALERVAWTIPEFCFRNNISQPKYTKLRAEGRGPQEMRLGLNLIRITAEAELEWQRRMQEVEDARQEASTRPAPPRPGTRLTVPEQRELKRTEERIEKAEAEVEALKAKMADPAVAADHLKLQAAWQEVQSAEARVAELYARWEELEAKRSG